MGSRAGREEIEFDVEEEVDGVRSPGHKYIFLLFSIKYPS